MRVRNKASVFIGILVLFVCIAACGKTDGVQLRNDATAESQAEEILTHTEESGVELPEKDEAQDDMTMDNNGQIAEEREESEDMAQTQQNYTYRGDAVLTEDNIKETMKSFLQISDRASFARLETLPLTEKFFNECIEHPENFPYVDLYVWGLQMREFKLVFWGIREDGKCVCLCELCTSFSQPGAKSKCYYVEMDLKDEQIDSMEVTLVKPDSPHF